MIVTLTANPSLDRAVTLSASLRPGEVQSAASSREDAGGKGINVARVVTAAGGGALAVLPLAVPGDWLRLRGNRLVPPVRLARFRSSGPRPRPFISSSRRGSNWVRSSADPDGINELEAL